MATATLTRPFSSLSALVSPLSIPPRSPHSPNSSHSSPSLSPISPPPTPTPWYWTCHLCYRSYNLATTRRCLEDGHYFCAGTTRNRRTGKVHRHAPCGSNFDYDGWFEWNSWRRLLLNDVDPDKYPLDLEPGARNCMLACDFPSMCRWGPRAAKRQLRNSRASLLASLASITPMETMVVDTNTGSSVILAPGNMEPDTPHPTNPFRYDVDGSAVEPLHESMDIADVDIAAVPPLLPKLPSLEFAAPSFSAFEASLDTADAAREIQIPVMGGIDEGSLKKRRASWVEQSDLMEVIDQAISDRLDEGTTERPEGLVDLRGLEKGLGEARVGEKTVRVEEDDWDWSIGGRRGSVISGGGDIAVDGLEMMGLDP